MQGHATQGDSRVAQKDLRRLYPFNFNTVPYQSHIYSLNKYSHNLSLFPIPGKTCPWHSPVSIVSLELIEMLAGTNYYGLRLSTRVNRNGE